MKDPIPGGLRSNVVYKFACTGCNAYHAGETSGHFSTRVREHLVSDKASHIFKHLKSRLKFSRLFPYLRSCLYEFPAQDKRGYSYSKRTTLFESTVTSCKSKTILIILTVITNSYSLRIFRKTLKNSVLSCYST